MATMTKRRKIELKPCRTTLGQLEAEVMQVMWSAQECSVREVKQLLRKGLAYTTVMTTMARLFHKGLLKRRKQQHKFIYSARLSSERWARVAASEAIGRLLATPNAREVLVECLVEDLFRHDRTLLAAVNQRFDENLRTAAS